MTGNGGQRVKLAFSKMHGIGNDFAVLDWRRGPAALDAAQIRAMADRRTGIGFDQLLSIEPARDPSCRFYYGIWNTDGSPAGQCGNGVRCVAAWLHRAGELPLGEELRLQSPSGPVVVRLRSAAEVSVDMGEPDFRAAAVGFDGADADPQPLALAGGTVEAGLVSMGNPHAVVVVDDLEQAPLAAWGPAITAHPRFADGANAGFVQILDRGRLRLRVHERGSGWTLACGTGACAAAAVLQRRGLAGPSVAVALPGGELRIDWAGPGHALWMTGPAAFAFEGEWG